MKIECLNCHNEIDNNFEEWIQDNSGGRLIFCCPFCGRLMEATFKIKYEIKTLQPYLEDLYV